jgi:multiple inositol-polyphosphate phosphatase/2,3-bisphosphoglycerate 3-phosphatase
MIFSIENFFLRPEQIYIFMRHGARFPSTSQVHKSKQFLQDLARFKANSSKREMLDELRVTFEDSPHFGLTDLGVEEMQELGKRFKARYPPLFNVEELIDRNETDFTSHFDIVSSSKNRSINSGQNFLIGLYGSENDLATHLSTKFTLNDTLMRLFDSCDRYLHDVIRANKHNISAEMPLFKYGKEMTKLVEEFKARNDIPDMEIKSDLLLKLFTLCNIEDAHNMTPNWCRLFNESDYEVLSYYYDLKAYWVKSYGNALNSKMMFLFIQDLFNEMDKAVRNDIKK